MANSEQLDEQREETRLIIEELLEDGSDPEALYTIEHHLSAEKFEVLEKAAVEVFNFVYLCVMNLFLFIFSFGRAHQNLYMNI